MKFLFVFFLSLLAIVPEVSEAYYRERVRVRVRTREHVPGYVRREMRRQRRAARRAMRRGYAIPQGQFVEGQVVTDNGFPQAQPNEHLTPVPDTRPEAPNPPAENAPPPPPVGDTGNTTVPFPNLDQNRTRQVKKPESDTSDLDSSPYLVYEGGVAFPLSDWQKRAVIRTNELRATMGLRPLPVSKNLTAWTQMKANNMANANSMSHGIYPGPGHVGGGRENISMYPASTAVDGWWNSRSENGHPGISHYKNMIQTQTRIGVGIAYNRSGQPYSAMMTQ